MFRTQPPCRRSRAVFGIRRRPGRLALALFRMPLRAYHHGKGWLLGHTFLLLTHVGRRTGQPHETVAMVLRYRRESHEAVICSAWGSDTDWVRNIRERPAVRIDLGREAFEPEQRFLSVEESLCVVDDCLHQHPGASASWPGCWAGETCGSRRSPGFVRTRPFVAFVRRVRRRSGPRSTPCAPAGSTNTHHPSSNRPWREWVGEVIPLEPVDSVSITTVCDNVIDFWLLDEGPARRLLSRRGAPPALEAFTLEGGKVVDSPTAEPGFSAHIEITKGGRTHRLLFDAGLTPTGCRENLARLDLSPQDSRPSSAAMATSTTPPASPACSTCSAPPTCRSSSTPSSGAAGGSPSPVENPWSSPRPAAGPSRTAASPLSRTASRRSSSSVRFS